VRGGTLSVNKDGLLATAAGQPFKPTIAIPANAQSITISAQGHVLVTVPDQRNPISVGQFQMASFANPSQLAADSGGVYRTTELTGDPTYSLPGVDGAGTLAQGFLEGSNVRMVDEMVNLMLAQRSYEASVKVVQAADEMLGMVNNLRK
jgi:flagellar basal-body rod protein FlgG